MEMTCLDTDILVGFLRSNPAAVRHVQHLEEQHESLTTTMISVCELFEGAFRSGFAKEGLSRIEGLFQPGAIGVLPLSLEAAELFGKESARLKSKGHDLEDFDLLIGCIAVSAGQTLVTRNKKHFERIEGLTLETW